MGPQVVVVLKLLLYSSGGGCKVAKFLLVPPCYLVSFVHSYGPPALRASGPTGLRPSGPSHGTCVHSFPSPRFLALPFSRFLALPFSRFLALPFSRFLVLVVAVGVKLAFSRVAFRFLAVERVLPSRGSCRREGLAVERVLPSRGSRSTPLSSWSCLAFFAGIPWLSLGAKLVGSGLVVVLCLLPGLAFP